MDSHSESTPFSSLGSTLKLWRHQQKESLAEVAGAIELAEDELRQIELGLERPSEDILMLLISHFDVPENEAVRLWELAGYNPDDDADDDLQQEVKAAAKTIVMAIAMDPRVMYSDGVQISASERGLILNFLQPGMGQMPAMPIARIGVSREQAANLIALLQDTLDTLDNPPAPKQLPPQV